MNTDTLKNLVLKSGKTQKEIAEDLGLARQRFNFYVTGKRQPDNEMLTKIAAYFHVSVDYLLGLTDDPTPPSEQKNTPVAAKNNDQDIHAEFVKFLIADGIIEKEEDITPEQVEVMREAFRSTMKILRPKA